MVWCTTVALPPVLIARAQRAVIKQTQQTSDHQRGTREHIPVVGTNRRELESIFQALEPIAGNWRAYSRGWNQSQGTREHIPGAVRTSRVCARRLAMPCMHLS
eukprot:1196045-Prorocentrum_minimum.AAC.6